MTIKSGSNTTTVTETAIYPGVNWTGTRSATVRHFSQSGANNSSRNQEQRTQGYMTPTNYTRTETDTPQVGSSATRNRWVIVYQEPGYYWRGDGFFPYPPTWGWATDSCSFTHHAMPGTIDMTSDIAAAKNAALSRCIQQMRSQGTSLVETLAEAQKSANMIVEHVTRAAQAMRAMRRGDFQRAAHTLGLTKVPANAKTGKSPHGNWLAYRYGWTPLFLEINGEMENIYKMKTNYLGRIHMASGSSSSAVKEQTYVGSNTPIHSGTFGSYTTTSGVKADISVRCQVAYRTTSTITTSLSQHGLTNPLLVAWELLPLSFVADWFVNVSDVLERIDALAGKQFLYGFYTIKQRYRTTETYAVYPAANGSIIMNPRQSEVRHFTRETFSNLPYVVPAISNGLSTNRLIDAVALARQVFR